MFFHRIYRTQEGYVKKRRADMAGYVIKGQWTKLFTRGARESVTLKQEPSPTQLFTATEPECAWTVHRGWSHWRSSLFCRTTTESFLLLSFAPHSYHCHL